MAASLLPSAAAAAAGSAMAGSLARPLLFGAFKRIPRSRIGHGALTRPFCVSAYSKGVGKHTGAHEIILTKQLAQDLIVRLKPEERKILMDELTELVEKVEKNGKASTPTADQLRMMALHNALPFVGFGFLDNFIMIVAGDYIDTTIGIGLGISTMAAAGLGNAISDAAGIGSAWYVEKLAVKIGVQAPTLSPAQLEMAATRWSANIGRAVGVFVGCLIGMFPLLFLSSKEDMRQRHEQKPAAS
ncbi:transmembrane protein 65 [Haemaphysalis longicornis]